MNGLVEWVQSKMTLDSSSSSSSSSNGMTTRMSHLSEYHVNPYHVHFLAVGDTGNVTPGIKKVAKAMDLYARNLRKRSPIMGKNNDNSPSPSWSGEEGIDFIALLGDNFYPFGVKDASDPMFDTHWYDTFLKRYRSLRVPWNVVLGNHDYMDNPQAQVDFTYSDRNTLGLWNLPQRNYEFGYRIYTCSSSSVENLSETSEKKGCSGRSGPIMDGRHDRKEENSDNKETTIIVDPDDSGCKNDGNHQQQLTTESKVDENKCNSEEQEWEQKKIVNREREEFVSFFGDNHQSEFVEFFVLDTNACQDSVVITHPDSIEQLKVAIIELEKKLSQSRAKWKILLGHHPLYTQGKGHSGCAKSLRERRSSFNERELNNKFIYYGYGLEEILVKYQVDAYFAGHEHVFQYAYRKGIHHFCCGASGASQRPGNGFYGGENVHDPPLDWIVPPTDFGFVAIDITINRMQVQYISSENKVLKEVVVDK